MNTVDVVAAVRQRNDRYWICKRNHDGAHAGLRGMWEYPGGKVKDGESHEMAMHREMMEEFNVRCHVGPLLDTIECPYDDIMYRVHFYNVTFDDEPELRVHDDAGWWTVDQLQTHKLLSSDAEFSSRLWEARLPEYVRRLLIRARAVERAYMPVQSYDVVCELVAVVREQAHTIATHRKEVNRVVSRAQGPLAQIKGGQVLLYDLLRTHFNIIEDPS